MQIETTQAIPILRWRLISLPFKKILAEVKKQRSHPRRRTYASLNWSLRGLPCWTAKAYGLRLNSSPTRREEKEEKDKKGVKLIIMRENHKTLMEKVSNWQSKDKWQNKRTNFECISSKYNIHLPSEGRSWWVLGIECQLHHLVRGAGVVDHAKDDVARTKWLQKTM